LSENEKKETDPDCTDQVSNKDEVEHEDKMSIEYGVNEAVYKNTEIYQVLEDKSINEPNYHEKQNKETVETETMNDAAEEAEKTRLEEIKKKKAEEAEKKKERS